MKVWRERGGGGQEKGRWLNYGDGRVLRGILTVNYSETGDEPLVTSAASASDVRRKSKELWKKKREKEFTHRYAMKSNPPPKAFAREILLLITLRCRPLASD